LDRHFGFISRTRSFVSALLYRHFGFISRTRSFVSAIRTVAKTRNNRAHQESLTGLASEIVIGPAEKVLVWDGTMLHRSLPNSTEFTRLTLQWVVTDAVKGPELVYDD
jgi:hypothetical protein